jgi:hypothetical protein
MPHIEGVQDGFSRFWVKNIGEFSLPVYIRASGKSLHPQMGCTHISSLPNKSQMAMDKNVYLLDYFAFNMFIDGPIWKRTWLLSYLFEHFPTLHLQLDVHSLLVALH